jgi:hypothetical protein
MDRASALIQFIFSFMLLCVGFYTLHAGYIDSTAGSMIKLPLGAALIFIGSLAMSAVAQSHLRHVRQLQGQSRGSTGQLGHPPSQR